MATDINKRTISQRKRHINLDALFRDENQNGYSVVELIEKLRDDFGMDPLYQNLLYTYEYK